MCIARRGHGRPWRSDGEADRFSWFVGHADCQSRSDTPTPCFLAHCRIASLSRWLTWETRWGMIFKRNAASRTLTVAVDPTCISPDAPAVQAVVRAHRCALQVIHNDPGTTGCGTCGRSSADRPRKVHRTVFRHRWPSRPHCRRQRDHRGRRRTRRPRHRSDTRAAPHPQDRTHPSPKAQSPRQQAATGS